jgi:hypothetical protein
MIVFERKFRNVRKWRTGVIRAALANDRFPPTSAVRSRYARLKLETHLPHHNPVLKVKFTCQITLPKHSEIRIAEK